MRKLLILAAVAVPQDTLGPRDPGTGADTTAVTDSTSVPSDLASTNQ